MNTLKGLPNLGNTCYINTALQCLFSCNSFVHFLLSNTIIYNKSTLVSHLQHICKIDTLNKDLVSKYEDLLKYISVTFNDFNVHEHNDIHEFLLILLDKLTIEFGYKIDPILFAEKETQHLLRVMNRNDKLLKFSQKCNNKWFQILQNEHSSFIDLFCGLWVNQIICGNCHKIHQNYELFKDIEIDISNDTLVECLETHFKDSSLNVTEDENQWKCDSCNKKCNSLKFIKIFRLPKILIISLKRFEIMKNRLKKIHKCVDIPDTIDVKDFVIQNTYAKNTCYNLKAVANHMGNIYGGHYTASCKPKDKIYNINDEHIKHLSEYNHTNSYLLFYELTHL